MPGLAIFLPALSLPAFVCCNCGFWQRKFSQPLNCPVCEDYRHILPSECWRFYDLQQARMAFPMFWEEMLPGLWRFWNEPVDGIGSHSYLLINVEGNVIFEGATVYSEAAIEHIKLLGGVKYVTASHPHTYGALWQLQEVFEANVVLHKDDLRWSNAFQVTHPFDDVFEICSSLRLVHAGVHFEGQSFLINDELKIIFCGDAMKIDLDQRDPRVAVAISSHKSFVRNISLTPFEIKQYQKVFKLFNFDKVFTPFEQAYNLNSALIDLYFSKLNESFPQPNFINICDLVL